MIRKSLRTHGTHTHTTKTHFNFIGECTSTCIPWNFLIYVRHIILVLVLARRSNVRTSTLLIPFYSWVGCWMVCGWCCAVWSHGRYGCMRFLLIHILCMVCGGGVFLAPSSSDRLIHEDNIIYAAGNGHLVRFCRCIWFGVISLLTCIFLRHPLGRCRK